MLCTSPIIENTSRFPPPHIYFLEESCPPPPHKIAKNHHRTISFSPSEAQPNWFIQRFCEIYPFRLTDRHRSTLDCSIDMDFLQPPYVHTSDI